MNVKMMQVGPLGTNCYILEDEKTREAAVIDPGGDAPEIIRALEGAKLRYILLTHGHYDHTGGAAELERAFPQAALYIHQTRPCFRYAPKSRARISTTRGPGSPSGETP